MLDIFALIAAGSLLWELGRTRGRSPHRLLVIGIGGFLFICLMGWMLAKQLEFDSVGALAYVVAWIWLGGVLVYARFFLAREGASTPGV